MYTQEHKDPIYKQGLSAGSLGLPASASPHTVGSYNAILWKEGYDRGKRTNVKTMGGVAELANELREAQARIAEICTTLQMHGANILVLRSSDRFSALRSYEYDPTRFEYTWRVTMPAVTQELTPAREL